MARQIVLEGSDSQRPGVYIIDAPDRTQARQRVLAGEGQALWTPRESQLNQQLFRSVSPAARDAINKHIGDLNRAFQDSPIVQEHLRQTGQRPGILSRLTRLGAQAAPSIIGEEIAGQTARVLPQTRAFELPARSLGAMTGEAFRQIVLAPESEPIDLLEILAAGAIPAKGKVARQVARGLGIPERTAGSTRRGRIRFARVAIPGSGVALLDEAREEIAAIPQRFRAEASTVIEQAFPGQTAMDLRRQSLATNPEIRIPNLHLAARELLQDEDLASTFGAQLGGRAARIARTGQQLRQATLQQLNVLRRNLGGFIGQARNSGNKVVEERFRGLFAGLMQDIDNAVTLGIPGARAYKLSLEATRREFAAQAIEDAVVRFSRPVRGENFESLNISQFARDFQRAVTAEKAARPRGFTNLPDLLSEAEKKEITELLQFWNDALPALPTRMGINAPNVGSGQIFFRGSLGAGAAMMLNRIAGNVVSPGMAALVGGAGSALISNMIMSDTGRRLLRGFITQGGPINLTEMGVRWLAQGGRVEVFNRLESLNQRLQEPLLPQRIEAVR